jgi:exodeoxyribonuclease VII small subunit
VSASSGQDGGAGPPAASASTGPKDVIGYADALAELDRILLELEDENVDIDQLSTRVRRAGELVAVCRERILGARLEVTQVLASLDSLPPAEP